MKLGRRIQIITVISLLLASGVYSGLSGRPIDVCAAGLETVSSGDAGISSPPGTVSSGDAEVSSPSENVSSGDAEIAPPLDTVVPIYDYDILNVLVPTSYKVAFNPYGLNVSVGEGRYFNGQVISRNYGIVNESTRDKLVTVVLTIEDLNDGQITFVDSAEAARNADEDTFAIYLALVPADDGEILVNDQILDKDIAAGDLTDVSMGQSKENAVALLAGENRVTFKLSGAKYGFLVNSLDVDDGSSLDDGVSQDGSFQLLELAADGAGATAFTFDGVMNPDADWAQLRRGIKISVVYTYEDATGTEMIVEGTGAMVKVGEITEP